MSQNINKKKISGSFNIFAVGTIVIGALTIGFAQTLEPIECEPENIRWVGGPLGAVGKTCDRRRVNYE